MHVPQRQRALQLLALRTGLNKLTTTMINFSVGHAQTSSILDPSAYQIPRQHLYSRGGGQLPTFIQSLHPQQGNTHCGHYPILPHFHQKRSHGFGLFYYLIRMFAVIVFPKTLPQSFAVLIFGTFSML